MRTCEQAARRQKQAQDVAACVYDATSQEWRPEDLVLPTHSAPRQGLGQYQAAVAVGRLDQTVSRDGQGDHECAVA